MRQAMAWACVTMRQRGGQDRAAFLGAAVSPQNTRSPGLSAPGSRNLSIGPADERVPCLEESPL